MWGAADLIAGVKRGQGVAEMLAAGCRSVQVACRASTSQSGAGDKDRCCRVVATREPQGSIWARLFWSGNLGDLELVGVIGPWFDKWARSLSLRKPLGMLNLT